MQPGNVSEEQCAHFLSHRAHATRTLWLLFLYRKRIESTSRWCGDRMKFLENEVGGNFNSTWACVRAYKLATLDTRIHVVNVITFRVSRHRPDVSAKAAPMKYHSGMRMALLVLSEYTILRLKGIVSLRGGYLLPMSRQQRPVLSIWQYSPSKSVVAVDPQLTSVSIVSIGVKVIPVREVQQTQR